MRIKLYKKSFSNAMELAKDKEHQEYYAQIRGEIVSIEQFTFMQKLRAKEIFQETIAQEGMKSFPNVKVYKKDYFRRYNAYCSRVDDELRQKENR